MTWSAVLLLVSAPFIGSFLGVLVDRLPEGRSIVRPRSACDHCGRQLSARDLIPVVGWLLQRGRCRSCGAPIDKLYPILELASLLVAGWSLAVVPGVAGVADGDPRLDAPRHCRDRPSPSDHPRRADPSARPVRPASSSGGPVPGRYGAMPRVRSLPLSWFGDFDGPTPVFATGRGSGWATPS